MMINKMLLFPLVVLLLSGCVHSSSFYKQQETLFWVADDRNAFTYTAQCGDWSDPPEKESSEKIRLQWLNEYVTDNHMCPRGYYVQSREILITNSHPRGNRYIITYKGECK